MSDLYNSYKTFSNNEFGEIRVLEIENEPWFVGRDIATVLGYSNPPKAVRTHVDEEDKGVNEMDTPGGKQKIIVINESGLYSLILNSKLPNAKKFKRWVTNEVLPSIRKHGAYMTENAIEKALEDVTLSMIGEKIKTVRLQKGVSQAALAKCLGVSAAMIYQYEVGKKKPKVETLSKIAGALGVDLKVFYDDLPQKTMELKRYENIALVNEFENACFRLVNFPDSEEITEKYEKLRKKLIDRLSCM